MCMCSKNMHKGSGYFSPCGHNDCNSLGPFRAVKPGSTLPNTGTIIPFSSGTTALILPTLATGLAGVPSLIGFGTAVPGVAIVGNTLDLTGILTEVFSVPRNGSITAISASFTPTVPLAVAGTAAVTAQIFRAPEGSSVFTATNARVTLTPYTGAVATGDTSFASADVLPVAVSQGDRLVMVYSFAGTVTAVTAITGTASAGITIS